MSLIENPKAAIVTGVTTSASGLNTALGLDMIPDSIGKLATCAGIVLSCIMIKYWYQKTTIERKEAKLDMADTRSRATNTLARAEREKAKRKKGA